MQYLCLIYSSPDAMNKMSPEEHRQSMLDYGTFTQSIADSGHMLGSNALQGVDTATSVRVRGGKVLTTDGPFAETKEHLGGYYLIEAKTLDEAIAIAARIPSAKIGCVEVRPIMDYEEALREAQAGQ